jgi:hypothetical protein
MNARKNTKILTDRQTWSQLFYKNNKKNSFFLQKQNAPDFISTKTLVIAARVFYEI